MSRIGKLPIKIPENVDINFIESNISVKGKFGTLQIEIPETIQIKKDSGLLIVSSKNETRNVRSLHGLYRTLVNNMVIGVSEQFHISLNLQGVGYRASVQGDSIVLNLGYSHPVGRSSNRSRFSMTVCIYDSPSTVKYFVTQSSMPLT